MNRNVRVQYFGILREQRGCGEESRKTEATSPLDLYRELAGEHGFSLDPENLRVAVNDEFRDWDSILAEGDKVVFIPPVAGG